MKAVLVICEGHHDVEFVQRSLGVHGGCTLQEKALDEYPSPFGATAGLQTGFLVASFQRRSLKTFSTAIRALVPQFERALQRPNDDTLYLLLQTGGDQTAPVIALLKGLDAQMNSPLPFEITRYAVAFIFDADKHTIPIFQEHYGAHFGPTPNLTHGKWVSSNTTPVGVFIYPDATTLEDHLGPMLTQAWPNVMPKAASYVDGHRPPSQWSAASRWKAVITAAGQFKQPGAPMSQMLNRANIEEAVFQNSLMSKSLCDFILAAP